MSNNFYTPSGEPSASSRGRSSSVRDEFTSVAAGFTEVQDVATAAINGSATAGVDTGTANQYAVTVGTVDAASYVSAYVDGLTIRFRTSSPNTGSSVINVNSLGNKSILRRDGTALQSGDILANSWSTLTYNSAAGAFYLVMGLQGSTGTSGASVPQPYEERTNSVAQLGNADSAKQIKITGSGNSTQTFDSVANLSSGWFVTYWNGTTGYIQVTADGATYRMYPGEERVFYADKVNNRIGSRVTRSFILKDQSAGSFVVPPTGCGYSVLVVRATGSGAGGGGGGGGGSGGGGGTNSRGGGGGSGGAPGQSGASVLRRIPFSLLPAAGTSISYSPGAPGTKGSKGTGGAGATSGNNGNNGTSGASGAAGNPTTFGSTTDVWYVTAAGGASGTNAGNNGTGGTPSGGGSGGAAVTNSASTTAAAITGTGGAITTATLNGTASVAGSTQTSTTGAAGGASGDSSVGFALAVARSGASLAPGGAANSNAAPSPGNNGTTPSAETSPGVGGLGGGGGGGSPGVISAATGKGGDGGDGANGGPGEIELWAE
jgi:hypothetical protein